MARPSLRFLPRRATLARAATVCGIVAAATGLTATNSFADDVCADFTLSNADWYSNNWTAAYSSSVHLVFQGDGNLVLYTNSGGVLWASGSYGQNVTDLDWSASTGGILLKHKDGSIACRIGANAQGGWAQVQDDGNFVFYNSQGSATWAASWHWTTDACGF